MERSRTGTPLGAQSPFPAGGIDSLFAPYNRTDRPGCAVGVYRAGAIAYARGYGSANLEHGIAIARRAGLTVRTLHHYDHIGLVVPSVRTAAAESPPPTTESPLTSVSA